MKKIDGYQSSDGKIFEGENAEEDCRVHENELLLCIEEFRRIVGVYMAGSSYLGMQDVFEFLLDNKEQIYAAINVTKRK